MSDRLSLSSFGCVILALLLCGKVSIIYAQDEGTVLRLIVTDSNNRIKRGTGFVVYGHNYIVTAYHVVQDAKNIAVDRPQSLATGNLEVLSISPDWDIARLKLPSPLVDKVVPFRSGRINGLASKRPVTLLGYGSVLDRPQRYTGYHENAPYVPSQEWNRPTEIPGTTRHLFNLRDVKLLMLQAPTPYGVSGGPVIDAAGDVIGVISGALTRIENVTSLGWAIPIDYALQDETHLHGKMASAMQWPALKLLTDRDIILRAFGGPQLSLVSNLKCSDGIKDIERAWDTTVYAISSFDGYLRSARVSIDLGARQASSRETANMIIKSQITFLSERWVELRASATVYNKQILIAGQQCGRDIDSINEAMNSLPNTDNNVRIKVGIKQIADELVKNANLKMRKDMVQVEYELEKQWTKVASIKPLSDEGSSFFSRPSNSIESDIQMAMQFIDVMESMVQTVQFGIYKDVNREIESVLNSYLLWIDSANRQPWDRG